MSRDQSDASAAPSRANSFDGLRLLGALVVIWGHSYGLRGDWAGSPVLAGYEVQTLGVIVFFSISGYLITASWNRNPQVVPFLLARCLRIFPALVAVVGLTTLVLGPLVSVLSPNEYVARRESWSYLGNAALRFQQTLPGVWEDLPARWVNGSLWTLPIEFLCYLLVPATLLLAPRPRTAVVAVMTAAAVLITFWPTAESVHLWNTRIHEVATMGLFFVAGALLRTWQVRGHRFRPEVAASLLAAHVLLVYVAPGFQWHFGWLTLPYAVLWLGTSDLPLLRSAARDGDFSYGLYLWGFPVQQLVVDRLGVLPTGINLVVVLSLTAALAFVSWHVIERPALQMKHRMRPREPHGAET